MKKSYLAFLIIPVFISCYRNDKGTGPAHSVSSGINKQVMDIAVQYIKDKSITAKETGLKNGVIQIIDNQNSYVIDPASIVTGLIDEDANEDAIITIASFNSQFPATPEHLILLGTDGKLSLGKVFKADLKITGIKERIISAAIPKVDPDAPTHDCTKCTELAKYRYKNGDLVKTE